MKANIHFSRIGKGEALYVEDLIYEDSHKIITRSIVPPEFRKVWAKDAWAQKGIMSQGEVVCEVRKHHFYHQWFDIIELFDCGRRLIGYYCDVITPLRKENGEFYMLDLLLDLWVFPDGRTVELDWDEFHQAAHGALITPEQQQIAAQTLRRMVAEARQRVFPYQYIANLPQG